MQERQNGGIGGNKMGNIWEMAKYRPTDICVCWHPNTVQLEGAEIVIAREKGTNLLPHFIGEGITAHASSRQCDGGETCNVFKVVKNSRDHHNVGKHKDKVAKGRSGHQSASRANGCGNVNELKPKWRLSRSGHA